MQPDCAWGPRGNVSVRIASFVLLRQRRHHHQRSVEARSGTKTRARRAASQAAAGRRVGAGGGALRRTRAWRSSGRSGPGWRTLSQRTGPGCTLPRTGPSTRRCRVLTLLRSGALCVSLLVCCCRTALAYGWPLQLLMCMTTPGPGCGMDGSQAPCRTSQQCPHAELWWCTWLMCVLHCVRMVWACDMASACHAAGSDGEGVGGAAACQSAAAHALQL